MDGNRRWAKRNALKSVVEGHRRGARRFVDLCSWCIGENIPCLTVFAFSTENFNRNTEEVKCIFMLMKEFFENEISACLENGVRIKVIGNRSRMSSEDIKVIEAAERQSKDCDKLSVQIAIGYGGRDEIVRAVKKIVQSEGGKPDFQETFDEDAFGSYLDTGGLADVDLIIRTGAAGRKRLSGFLPWQSVYAELMFLDVLWPDFSKDDLMNAVKWYQSVPRNRGS